MARPTTPITLLKGAKTKKEKSVRQLVENRLRGEKFNFAIPENFTPEEKAAYTWLYDVLKASDILGELDRETVKLTAISIARLNTLDQKVRENPGLLLDKDFHRIRTEYLRQYSKLSKELCLSPAARSKIGSLAKAQEAEDPLMNVLKNKPT